MVAALSVAAFVSLVMMSDESKLESPVLMYSLIIAFFGSVGVWLIRVGRRMGSPLTLNWNITGVATETKRRLAAGVLFGALGIAALLWFVVPLGSVPYVDDVGRPASMVECPSAPFYVPYTDLLVGPHRSCSDAKKQRRNITLGIIFVGAAGGAGLALSAANDGRPSDSE
jgi:hypothetical protein